MASVVKFAPCPACQKSCTPTRNLCPHCGYSFQPSPPPVAAPPPAPVPVANLAACPSCNHPVSHHAASCPSCGHPINMKADNASFVMISLMWVFTVSAVMAALVGGVVIAIPLDILACIFGFALICSSNAVDRSNGWLKALLECTAIIVGVLIYQHK